MKPRVSVERLWSLFRRDWKHRNRSQLHKSNSGSQRAETKTSACSLQSKHPPPHTHTGQCEHQRSSALNYTHHNFSCCGGESHSQIKMKNHRQFKSALSCSQCVQSVVCKREKQLGYSWMWVERQTQPWFFPPLGRPMKCKNCAAIRVCLRSQDCVWERERHIELDVHSCSVLQLWIISNLAPDKGHRNSKNTHSA